jgi:hypothetical protein
MPLESCRSRRLPTRPLRFEALERRIVLDADDFEPNDSFGSAYDLGSITGDFISELSIHESGNGDYFRFTSSFTGEMPISVSFEHDLGDIDLRVYDAFLDIIEESGSTTDSEEVVIDAAAGQSYYVYVFGFGGDTNPNYDLQIGDPPPDTDAFEPNDSAGSAYNLGSLSGRLLPALSIHAAGNADYFRFTSNLTGQLPITLEFEHDLGDVDLRVYNNSQILLGSSTSTDDSEEYVLNAVAGQTYFVHVFGFSGATNPQYSLQIGDPSSDIPPDAWEPNDSFLTAHSLGTITTFSANGLTIHASSNYDYFSLTAGMTGTLTVSLAFEHDQGDVDLYIYNAAQQERDSSTSTTDAELASISVVQGQTYYIRAHGFGGDTNPDYDIQINITPLAGDYDDDGVVDGSDFLRWQRTVGSSVDFSADGNGDNQVNGADLDVWQAGFGAPTAAVQSTAVLLALDAAHEAPPMNARRPAPQTEVVVTPTSRQTPSLAGLSDAHLRQAIDECFTESSSTPKKRWRLAPLSRLLN